MRYLLLLAIFVSTACAAVDVDSCVLSSERVRRSARDVDSDTSLLSADNKDRSAYESLVRSLNDTKDRVDRALRDCDAGGAIHMVRGDAAVGLFMGIYEAVNGKLPGYAESVAYAKRLAPVIVIRVPTNGYAWAAAGVFAASQEPLR